MSSLLSQTFCDIHCHLLPGVDDGAVSWEETLAMARLAVADGISTVVVTPHQFGGCAENHGELIRAQTTRLQQFLLQQEVPLRVLPGAEVRIEPDLVRKLQSGQLLTLADRRRHVLLELPSEIYLPLDRLVYQLGAVGMVGILAHPERNLGIVRQPRVLEPLIEAGCLLQVTAGSLIGAFGPEVQELTQRLVRQQLVHFVATDAHGTKSRRPLLRRAFDCVARLAGEATAVDLCCRNPALVAAGKSVTLPRRRPTKEQPAGWFRWSKAG